MEHIKILGAFFNLIIGATVAVYVYQKYKSYGYSYLKPLTYHIVFYNLMISVLLISKYLSLNLPEKSLQAYFSGSDDIGNLLLSLFSIGMVLSIYCIILGFKERKISSREKKGVATGITLLVLSYIVKIILPHKGPSYEWFDFVLESIIDIVFLMEIALLITLRVYGKRSRDREKTKITNAFAYLYLARYPVVVLSIFASPPVRLFMGVGALILFNMIPLFWLKYYFLKYAGNMLSLIEDKPGLDRIYEKYAISRREQEIIRLLLDGKSNKEIEDTLFISIHTVKNHIYNVYRKLGVNNRFQLVHFFIKFQETAQK